MADDTTSLLTLLKTVAAEQHYPDPDIQISPISTSGANYSSRIYLIKISSTGKDDLRLFAKKASLGEQVREQCTLEPFVAERFMYTELIKIYRELEDKHNVPESQRLAVPKFFGADATHMQETVVLEDLACQGFTLHSRHDPVSWEYAAAAITELAKFHSLSLAFKKNNPSEFDKIASQFKHGMYTEHDGNHVFYNSSSKSALAAVREENRDKLQRFLDGASLGMFCSMYGPLKHTVLIHADFRPSNMLHRLRQDGSLELKVVDYQTIQAGCPVVDLVYFFFTGTGGPFRAKYYQKLVDHYHSELSAALARLDVNVDDVYSRKDFEFELREKLPYGLLLSVVVLPALMVEEEQAPQLDEEFNMVKLAFTNTGGLYSKRINEVVDDYVKWGVLV